LTNNYGKIMKDIRFMGFEILDINMHRSLNGPWRNWIVGIARKETDILGRK